MSEWKFFAMSPQGLRESPKHGELFDAGEDLDQRDLLVRETLQNAIDARCGEEAITVSFRLGTVERPSHEPLLAKLLDEPERRVRAARDGDLEHDATTAMRYLVVEDFNTWGLTGDVRRTSVGGETGSEHRFFYFWRNIGLSGKPKSDGTNSLGSWGLGKAVYYKASSLGTYFGLSRRADDERTTLMGLALVGAHELEGASWQHFGYWGIDEGPDQPILPTDDAETMSSIATTFGLTRKLDQDSGLSVIVPCLDDAGWRDDPAKPDWTARRLARAAIEQFYLPVLAGELVLQFTDELETITVDRDTIDSVAQNTRAFDDDPTRAAKSIALARLWLKPGSVPNVELPRLSSSKATWDAWSDVAGIEKLRAAWAKSGRIIITVPLQLKSKKYGTEEGRFSVVLERDDDLTRGEADFYRGRMKVPGVKAAGLHRARALVLVPTNDPLARMLGHAENPAHTHWKDRTDALEKAGYSYRTDNLRFVRTAPRGLLQMLDRGTDDKDRTALADIFPHFVTEEVELKDGTKEKRRRRKGKTKKPGPIPEGKPVTYRIDDVDSGFRVSFTDAAADSYRIRAAYASGSGKTKFNAPISAKVADFDFTAPVEWGLRRDVTANAAIEELGFQEFRIVRTEAGPFHVEWAGFDQNRDLSISVTKVADS